MTSCHVMSCHILSCHVMSCHGGEQKKGSLKRSLPGEQAHPLVWTRVRNFTHVPRTRTQLKRRTERDGGVFTLDSHDLPTVHVSAPLAQIVLGFYAQCSTATHLSNIRSRWWVGVSSAAKTFKITLGIASVPAAIVSPR